MKEEIYTLLICKRFCEYYAVGKEFMLCKTYEFIRDAVPVEKLQEVLENVQKTAPATQPTFSYDKFINGHICSECDFRGDGCDYAAGLDSPPCGGYKVVELLKERGII
ncbi:MAG: hypothetical protein HQK97_09435 [Nitrospirae bacterium]|nr:hypothetical protein [Nitrospirota bacterium]